MGHVQLPEGKIAVNLGADFDAQCLWLGAFNKPSPSYLSRGELGHHGYYHENQPRSVGRPRSG